MRTLTVKNQSGEVFEVDENNVMQAEKDGFLPVVSNGQEEHRVSYNDLPQAEKDGFSIVDQSKKPSILASALRKGAQGVSSGLSDEISGLTEAAGRAVGFRGAGGPIKDISIDERGPTLNLNELKDSYNTGKLEERDRLDLDQKTNPVTSTVMELGTAIASPMNKIAGGMSMLKGGAVLGGLNAFGRSEADSVGGVALDTALGAGTGAALGYGTQKAIGALSPAMQSVAQKISPAREKKNMSEIISAANRLGVKPTPGMLDDTGFVERMEYTLANSPSLLGQRVKRAQESVAQGVDDAIQSATKEASGLSSNQIGEKFKSALGSKIAERSGPISQVFDEVAESTKYIPLTERSKELVLKKIAELPEFRLSGGSGKLGEFQAMLQRAETAADVKTIGSLLNQEIRAAKGSERMALSAAKDIVQKFEKNSIMRSAIQQAREGGMREATGRKIGNEIIGELKDARAAYKTLADDLGQIAENARIKFQGPSTFVDDVEKITSERIQDKFFNVENLRQLQALKTKFPEEFELLKQGKLKDIVDASFKSTSQGDGISANRFVTEINKIGPEAKELLFGKSVQLLKDVETLQRSMPRNFNPSGTASQQTWANALTATPGDIPNFLLYKGASSNLGKKIQQNVSLPSTSDVAKVSVDALKRVQGPSAILAGTGTSAGTQSIRIGNEEKGIARWISKGQERVLEADSSIDPEFLKQNKSNKQIRQGLIFAGEAKPGSSRLNEIINQIKSSKEYQEFQKKKEKSAQGKEPDQSSVKPKTKFPKVVLKGEYSAVVRNDKELEEALAEGWA
jgi:hypothetical protein